jgi:hypothetical protein
MLGYEKGKIVRVLQLFLKNIFLTNYQMKFNYLVVSVISVAWTYKLTLLSF